MHRSAELLDQPAERAARIVALGLLDKAAAARQRLDDPSDNDAIHDFRVAVRRLRSWVRGLEPWLSMRTRCLTGSLNYDSSKTRMRASPVHGPITRILNEIHPTLRRAGASPGAYEN